MAKNGETLCRVDRVSRGDRAGWALTNGTLEVLILAGGGHLASVALAGRQETNPLWQPPWPSIEPRAFRPKRHDALYGGPPEGRLLASIMGHNLCLDLFGGPTETEAAAGMTVHGEAPVATWQPTRHTAGPRGCSLTIEAGLRQAGLRVRRTVRLTPGAHVVHVEETVANLTAWDRPVMWCQHVTLGPPFLDREAALFDLSGDVGRTYPAAFDHEQRLAKDASFRWPLAPDEAGGASHDLRRMRPGAPYGDFAAIRMDPGRATAWFTAARPDRGLLFGYLFCRHDFPWLGIWDQAGSRTGPPWNGVTLARGMEFSTTPFPMSRRGVLAQPLLEGQPTYRWLPARAQTRVRYACFLVAMPHLAEGVADVSSAGADRGYLVHPRAAGAQPCALGRIPLGAESEG